MRLTRSVSDDSWRSARAAEVLLGTLKHGNFVREFVCAYANVQFVRLIKTELLAKYLGERKTTADEGRK